MQDSSVANVVEILSHITYLGGIFKQYWVIRPHGDTIAIVDERTGDTKFLIDNPDGRMKETITEITENGWIDTKTKFLTNHEFKAQVIDCTNE